MLRFVVALQAEARPLVDRFRMETVHEGPFRIFRGEGGWLVVSGQGKAAAAAAAAYLHLFSGGALGRVWLNVGIGGHSRRPVGEGVVAHKVTDHASGLSWYPQLVLDSPGPTVSLLTIERVEDEYSPPWVYESEAAGFVPTASRFSLAELVHCYKVISDNPDATLSRRMSSAGVEDLIQRNLDGIEGFARSLTDLALEMELLAADPPGYRGLLERWPLNAAQQSRLRRLLQRLAVLDPEHARTGFDLGRARDGRDVLRILETRLAEIPVQLPAPGGVRSDVVR